MTIYLHNRPLPHVHYDYERWSKLTTGLQFL